MYGKVFGAYILSQPVIYLADADLIKQVTVQVKYNEKPHHVNYLTICSIFNFRILKASMDIHSNVQSKSIAPLKLQNGRNGKNSEGVISF